MNYLQIIDQDNKIKFINPQMVISIEPLAVGKSIRGYGALIKVIEGNAISSYFTNAEEGAEIVMKWLGLN